MISTTYIWAGAGGIVLGAGCAYLLLRWRQAKLLAAQQQRADELVRIARAEVEQLTAQGTPAFKRALVGVLSEVPEAGVGAALSNAYSKLPADVQLAAFDAVLKRADWANAFLDAVRAKQVDPMTLGPASAFRLRTHPDREVSKRATDMLEELNPMAKQKKEVLAKLSGIVDQKGDVAKGKALFAASCAISSRCRSR